MWARKPRARASRTKGRGSAAIDRRTFLGALLALGAWPWTAARAAGEAAPTPALQPPPAPPESARRGLEADPYVYVSPLRRDGEESTCHGEVWFAWLDDAVVVTTSTRTWKARALGRGLDRARLWVGDFGRWKRLVGRNEAFRKGPTFLARAEAVKDPELLERLLAVFREKYPDEIGRWEQRMRRGHADGTRVLIRYEALPAQPDVTRPGAGSP